MTDSDLAPTPNLGTVDFLEYYCNTKQQLGYATLITGPWGVGKSYFIKSFLKNRAIKHIYVSLYGMTATSQIDDEIFRILHPFITSKGMKFATQIVKSAVRNTLKFEFGDKADKDALDIKIPEIDIEAFFGDMASGLIVFDDLERCDIPLSTVLGYINGYVEHEDLKIIVLCNEAEILKKDEKYERIKEKLFGRSLEIEPDFDEAFSYIVGDLKSDVWVTQFLESQKQEIHSIFDLSKTKNFRVLRYAMLDIERFLISLNKKYREYKDELSQMVILLLLLSIEYRVGNISADDVSASKQSRYMLAMSQSGDGQLNKQQQLYNKYKDIQLYSEYLKPEIIRELIVTGRLDNRKVQQSIDSVPPFSLPSSEPSWKVAWHSIGGSDEHFEASIKILENDFRQLKYDSRPEIYHTFGILLFAAKIGALRYSPQSLLVKGRSYIRKLYMADRLSVARPSLSGFDTFTGYDGLAYIERNTIEFNEFNQFYHLMVDKKEKSKRGELIHILTELLGTNPRAFVNLFVVNNGTNAEYWEKPMLQHFSVRKFTAKYLSLDTDGKFLISSMFRERYQYNKPLTDELPWLESLKKSLLSKAKQARPLSRSRLQGLIENVDEAIAKLKP